MTTAALSCPACDKPVELGDRFCEICGGCIPSRTVAASGDAAGDEDSCAACGASRDQLGDAYCGVCGTRQPAPAVRRAVRLQGAAAVTDRGRVRARNEDAFAISVTSDGRLVAIVCDGISSTAGSDRASQAAADAGLAALLDPHEADGWEDLDAAFDAARAAVHQIPWTPEEVQAGPPSCTFVAAVVADADIRVSSLGDCRALWLPRIGEPRTLTVDDSWASEQVATGAMTAEAAHQDPRSHTITRWLGRDAEPSWVPRRVSLASGGPGRLVLCSDGLWNYAADLAEIAAACPTGDPGSIASNLVDWANARGGRDNVTVAVLEVGMPNGSHRTEEEGRGT